MVNLLKKAFFLLLITVAQLALAETPSVAKEWQGNYFYPTGDSRPPVSFRLTLNPQGNLISGTIREPATFGNGSSSELFANIKGIISQGGISFTKTYDGTGGVGHSVEYSGIFSTDGSKIYGVWNIGSFSGKFSANAVLKP